MNRKWKFLMMSMLLVTVLAFAAACGGNAADPAPAPGVTTEATPQPPAPPAGNDGAAAAETTPADDTPVRDLGGMTIIWANWWGDYSTDTFEPTTAEEEARLDDRIYVQERYNFRFEQRQMGDWGGVRDMIPLEILAGNRDVHIWVMQPDWFGNLQRQRLLAPIPEHLFDPDSGILWNQAVINATRRDGVPHGWHAGLINNGGVYFNMRLLEEAGIDPELPFDLQLSGQWTWDAFVDLLHRTTRDLTGDGVPDTWGMATFSSDILGRALASNNTQFVSFDAAGNLVNETTSIEFLEAFAWTNNLHDIGVMMPQPEDTEWNWFLDAFYQGNTAFRVAGYYAAGGINNNLIDPWGFVTFPMGPRTNTYRMMGASNPNAIPVHFSPEEVDDIMFAWKMWSRPLPEFSDPLAWTAASFATFYHPRSVEETQVMFTRNPEFMHARNDVWVPGGLPSSELFAWQMWLGYDAAVIIEEAQPYWTERINEANQD